MKFEELTPDEQSLLMAFQDELFRPVEGQVNRAFSTVQHMLDVAGAGVAATLKQLDAGVVLPSKTGLSGAQPLTKDRLESALAKYAQAAALFNADADRQARIQAAGIGATAP